MSESVSAMWACIALFANAICRKRYKAEEPKGISIDVNSATLMLCSVFLFTVDGEPFLNSKVARRAVHLDKGNLREMYRGLVSNIYKTKDGRYFHSHGSLNATPTLDMLGLPHSRPDLQGKAEECKDVFRAAVAQRDSISLEAEANERWLQPGVICRTVNEYAATPHGEMNLREPLYSISKVHERLPRIPWPDNRTLLGPLAGIKVLDLTKVIAGPTITRVLALMGADVLRLSTDTQPEALIFIADGQLGKRDADVNLKSAEGKRLFEALLEEADVVVSSYRPGTFERLGLGRNWVHELARRRGKGIVYCRENCYGWIGEWSGRAGYQQISDCVTGAAWEQGRFLGLDEPVMPLLPNSDSQTGLAGAIAVMQALLRRSSEGGSYNIEVSLNQFNNWLLRSVGLHDQQTQLSLRALHPNFLPRHDTAFAEICSMVIAAIKESNGTGSGELWDTARFTRNYIEWGRKGEEAEYLDWRRIVWAQNRDGEDEALFNLQGISSIPGSHEGKWLQGE